jgi:hypothetical protein
MKSKGKIESLNRYFLRQSIIFYKAVQYCSWPYFGESVGGYPFFSQGGR